MLEYYVYTDWLGRGTIRPCEGSYAPLKFIDQNHWLGRLILKVQRLLHKLFPKLFDARFTFVAQNYAHKGKLQRLIPSVSTKDLHKYIRLEYLERVDLSAIKNVEEGKEKLQKLRKEAVKVRAKLDGKMHGVEVLFTPLSEKPIRCKPEKERARLLKVSKKEKRMTLRPTVGYVFSKFLKNGDKSESFQSYKKAFPVVARAGFWKGSKRGESLASELFDEQYYRRLTDPLEKELSCLFPGKNVCFSYQKEKGLQHPFIFECRLVFDLERTHRASLPFHFSLLHADRSSFIQKGAIEELECDRLGLWRSEFVSASFVNWVKGVEEFAQSEPIFCLNAYYESSFSRKNKEIVSLHLCEEPNLATHIDVAVGKLGQLKVGEKYLLPGVWHYNRPVGHAVCYVFERQSDKSFSLTVVNTGDGNQLHQSKWKRMKRFLCPYYSVKNISIDSLKDVLTKLDNVQLDHSGKEFYEKVVPGLGEVDNRKWGGDFYATPQRSGSCTLSSFKAALRYLCTSKEQYKRGMFKLKANSIVDFYGSYKEHLTLRGSSQARLLWIALKEYREREKKLLKNWGISAKDLLGKEKHKEVEAVLKAVEKGVSLRDKLHCFLNL